MSDLPVALFVRAEPAHGGMTAYAVWTVGGDHHGQVEQFPTQNRSYWRAWRHPSTGQIPVVCSACGAPRRFARRRDAAAALLAHNNAYQPVHAALVLATAALRLLTTCDHGEQQPGTCLDCEPLEPLVQVALDALPLLCPNLSDHADALGYALGLVATAAGAAGDSELNQLATALRHATTGSARRGTTRPAG